MKYKAYSVFVSLLLYGICFSKTNSLNEIGSRLYESALEQSSKGNHAYANQILERAVNYGLTEDSLNYAKAQIFLDMKNFDSAYIYNGLIEPKSKNLIIATWNQRIKITKILDFSSESQAAKDSLDKFTNKVQILPAIRLSLIAGVKSVREWKAKPQWTNYDYSQIKDAIEYGTKPLYSFTNSYNWNIPFFNWDIIPAFQITLNKNYRSTGPEPTFTLSDSLLNEFDRGLSGSFGLRTPSGASTLKLYGNYKQFYTGTNSFDWGAQFTWLKIKNNRFQVIDIALSQKFKSKERSASFYWSIDPNVSKSFGLTSSLSLIGITGFSIEDMDPMLEVESVLTEKLLTTMLDTTSLWLSQKFITTQPYTQLNVSPGLGLKTPVIKKLTCQLDFAYNIIPFFDITEWFVVNDTLLNLETNYERFIVFGVDSLPYLKESLTDTSLMQMVYPKSKRRFDHGPYVAIRFIYPSKHFGIFQLTGSAQKTYSNLELESPLALSDLEWRVYLNWSKSWL